MRKLCPNFERENGLDTVLEVPVPDEMFGCIGGGSASLRWQNMRSWIKSSRFGEASGKSSTSEFMLLLKLVGSPLIPFQIHLDIDKPSKVFSNCSSVAESTAKYILQQYIAATGGETLLNSVHSMYAVGQLKILSSDIHQSCFNGPVPSTPSTITSSSSSRRISRSLSSGGSQLRRVISSLSSNGTSSTTAATTSTTDEDKDKDNSSNVRVNTDVGGFVLWQKNPDLWFLELVVSGCKVSAGCDGRITWTQSSSQPSLPSKGLPRPLRRFFQGIDPRSTASLFSEAVCAGEKTVNEEECFILKRDASIEALKAQSSPNAEIVHHTVWGYFSQRTGLLVQLEDTKLVKMQAATANTSSSRSGGGSAVNKTAIFWETTLETSIEDYRNVDGITIAHGGRTNATLYRYGGAYNHKGKVEENWSIEEIDFNVSGLSGECFMPPAEVYRARQ